MTGDRKREPYPTVGKATRLFIDGVVRDKNLKGADLRVALALIHATTTWSKLDDAISRAQLAELADVTEGTVAKAMKRLEDGGHIVYHRSRIKGIASIVRLNGVSTADTRIGESGDQMGYPDPPFGVSDWPDSGVHSAHVPEDLYPEDLDPCVDCGGTGRAPDVHGRYGPCGCPLGDPYRESYR